METNEFIARLLIGALAAGIVAVLAVVSAQARPDRRGWRQVKVGVMHWTGVILGTALTGLFSYVWMFVGSTRSDAETQMTVLFWLIVVFGLGTIIVGWGMYLITARGLEWRGTLIAFNGLQGQEKRSFADLASLDWSAWGHMVISFKDGSVLRLDPSAVGAREFIDAVADHLKASVGELE